MRDQRKTVVKMENLEQENQKLKKEVEDLKIMKEEKKKWDEKMKFEEDRRLKIERQLVKEKERCQQLQANLEQACGREKVALEKIQQLETLVRNQKFEITSNFVTSFKAAQAKIKGLALDTDLGGLMGYFKEVVDRQIVEVEKEDV
ncbi:hypothetical protein VNO78_24616 [Psophocarpus tetragonolobus]|uniref:Uncharacterized protein n=1 Tax=Psophocarpus tetragonolobus TaxID=3891 RepID=A0AAN9S4L6_PSOTE